MAQLYLLYADTACLKYLDRLQQADALEEYDIIRLMEAMLIGDEFAEKMIEEAIKKYPRNAELEYLIWLYEMDKGGFAEKAAEAAALSESIVFSHLPYEALFYYSNDIDPGLALAYLDTMEIGRLKHKVKGGMVSSFVLGNTYYGLASAGDIGPDFLRNYAFTIDPFRKRLIIEMREEG